MDTIISRFDSIVINESDNSLSNNSLSNLLSKMLKPQLLQKCNELGIKNYKSKTKSELINLIELKNELSIKNNIITTPLIKLNEINMLDEYYKKIHPKIKEILLRPSKNELTYDIMDTKKQTQNKLIALKEKQRQMKIGNIMQVVLGEYDTFTNLGQGHKTGLDIISEKRKIIIELKNRTNTNNSSSLKCNLDKLSKFKIDNPEYMCIYGCVNDDTEDKTKTGMIETFYHNGVELHKYVGYKLLKFILGEDMDKIILYVQNLIDELT
jgi:hypothetical protein